MTDTPATVTVPVEPTLEMRAAGRAAHERGWAGRLTPLRIWEAMLAARPAISAAPVGEGGDGMDAYASPEAIASVMSRAALTPREEAPAEAGELAETIAFLNDAAVMLGRGEMPAPGSQYAAKWWKAHAVALAALRARSSEPVAGLRPIVLAFAHLMEAKLRVNEWKGGWQKCSPESLLARVREETDELADAIEPGSRTDVGLWRALVANEAADVANMSMMVADVCGGLDADACQSISDSYSHPAAGPDKLRVAREALEKARSALHHHYVEWDGEPEDAVPLQLARAECDQALAALNAEGL